MTLTRRQLLVSAGASVVVTACGFGGRANSSGNAKYPDPGINDTSIQLGGTFPETGAIALYASLAKGMNAYFQRVNAQGGVAHRKISFTYLDDAYNPAQALQNARTLVEGDRVFAFTGFGGIEITIMPYATQHKVPQVFIFAGNTPLGNVKQYPYTRSWWPDISYEGYVVTKFALDRDPNAKIGTLMLANDLGPSQTAGVKQALGSARARQLVLETTYQPTATEATSQLQQLRSAGVNVLISQLGGETAISGIRYMAEIGWKPLHLLYSGSTSIAAILQKAGPQNAAGTYSALWLKDPADPRWGQDTGITAYKKAIASYGAGADPNDLFAINGYAAGQAWVTALQRMASPTRRGMLDALDALHGVQLDTMLPGITLDSGPGGRMIFAYQVVSFNGTSWVNSGPIIDARKLGIAR